MTFSTALRLGRVSNLPTVWSNCLAGAALAGGSAGDVRLLPIIAAVSLFYVAGMYLNDAFDRHIDAVERPERPIPSGNVVAATVFVSGFLMFAVGLGTLAAAGLWLFEGAATRLFLAGTILCGLITLYDWKHKSNPASPLVMGACRMMVYAIAGLAVTATPSNALVWGAIGLLAWLIGLTYLAKQENLDRPGNLWPLGFLFAPLVVGAWFAFTDAVTFILWLGLAASAIRAIRLVRRPAAGDIGRAVTLLIAAISLLDGLYLASIGQSAAASFAAGAFVLTLSLQRLVPGT